MTLAALAATLELYLDPNQALRKIPLLAMLDTNLENLKNRAERMAPQLLASPLVEHVEVVADQSQLGGGSVPTQNIPTWCVAVRPAGISLDQFARRLRMAVPAVYGRIQQERLLLDLRTVFPSQDLQVVETVLQLDGSSAAAADSPEPEE